MATISKGRMWAGWIMSAIPALFMLFGAVMDFMKPPQVIEGLTRMGYPETVATPLGVVILITALLYIYPRTAVLGAIILTGYLGGAVASHVRIGEGFGEYSMALIFGVLVWGGLYLRDPRVAALIPISQDSSRLR